MEIPKKIHYCWFGEAKKNKLFDKCCKSWKKFFPDYEIIEWNEKNFDVNCNAYVKEAYENKKYAFVSDYARLKIIYDNGGIYLDTDVEILKNYSGLLKNNGYLAFENKKNINTGLGFAANKGNEIIKSIMDSYEDIHFIDEKGNMDLLPCPARNMEVLSKIGLRYSDNIQEFYGFKVYPPKYFCGFDLDNSCYNIEEETVTVHHYDGSWTGKKEKIVSKLKRKICSVLGRKNVEKIRRIKKKIKGEDGNATKNK